MHKPTASNQPPSPTPSTLDTPAAPPSLWLLDPAISFLNHGSFGSCPKSVLDFQQEVRKRIERQPIQFFVRDLESLLDSARHELARFLGAEADNIVFIPNATTGVNTVLRSLHFEPGDELLVTNHEYNACRNALNLIAERTPAVIKVVQIPFPLRSADEIVQPILAGITLRTKLALLDHVTSQTGLIFPIPQLVKELSARGVDTLLDGAHAPGMIPLNLRDLNAAYYTGNCHKWICAPKGAAFLHVRPDRQDLIRPLTISHGANSPRMDRSRFQIEFGWCGTWDPSAYLSVPTALRFMGSQLPGGWPDVMARNHQLALRARELLCNALAIELPAPDNLLGALVSIPLPDSSEATPARSPLYLDALQDQLLAEHQIEVPIIPWPQHPKRLLRISAQLYNSSPQYEVLAQALPKLLHRASVVTPEQSLP